MGYLEGPPKKKTRKEMPMTMHYINKWEPGESKTMVAALSAPPFSQVPLPLQHELLVECPRSDDVIIAVTKKSATRAGLSCFGHSKHRPHQFRDATTVANG